METKEELKKEIAKKKKEVEELKKQATLYSNLEQSAKIGLNGAYGAMANKHCAIFSNAVAGSITAHGRDLIQFMAYEFEQWAYFKWHLDYELHKKLGISNVTKIDHRWIDKNGDFLLDENGDDREATLDELKQIEDTKQNFVRRLKPVLVYNDTDSGFYCFEPFLESSNWTEDPTKFIHLMNTHFIKEYFSNKCKEYVDTFGGDNHHDFELEQICKSIIFLEKKKYIKNSVWSDGGYVETNPDWCKTGKFTLPETDMQSKGIELVQGNTPKFARTKIYEIIKWYFKYADTISDRELIKMLRDLKNEFKLAPLDDICIGASVNNYMKYVIDDNATFQLRSACPRAIKAAAFSNYLLNQNSQYKSKYTNIKSGTKVKIYFTTNKLCNEFAFVSGHYPYEYATTNCPIDYDTQFEKCILAVVNRFNNVIGLSKVTSRLTFTLSLF